MDEITHYPITIAETSFFQRSVKKILTEEELHELIGHVAFNPTVGDIIPQAGGIRKLRWAIRGHGKRKGARIIYFYYDLLMPLYLLAAYPKSQKLDLTKEEMKEMRQLGRDLVRANHRRGRLKLRGA